MAKMLLKNHPVHCLVTDYSFSFALRKDKKHFLEKHQTNFPKRYKKKQITKTVKTLNLLSNVIIKPSFFQLLRSSHLPKHKTRNTHSSTC
jgi:hypothetical protein